MFSYFKRTISDFEIAINRFVFFTDIFGRKLGVSFWRYLKGRIENIGIIPDLSVLIRQQSQSPG